MKIRVLYARLVKVIGTVLVVGPSVTLSVSGFFGVKSKLFILGMIGAIFIGAMLQGHGELVE